MDRIEFAKQLNEWGRNRVPFLFIIDFEMRKPLAFKWDEIKPDTIRYSFNGFTNTVNPVPSRSEFSLRKLPEPFSRYETRFQKVYNHLRYGDSFLTNLTIKTKVEPSHSLMDLYAGCHARYKLLMDDQFLVFSPETFIQIRDGCIYSNPMKGTIDAGISGAKEIILNNAKEKAEHITIVDLLRNDLSQVSTNVQVTRFRYVEEIKTNTKNLLQVSSEITGHLKHDYYESLGDIVLALLPAGSVSGAPKPKTLEIIREAEQEDRGYYSGVFGYFDGANLDSGVMIRFIEKTGDAFFYRSGGGITTQSDAAMEYGEALDKIYVPVN